MLHFWDPRTGAELRSLERPSVVGFAAFRPGGQELLSLSGGEGNAEGLPGGQAQLWDGAGKPLGSPLSPVGGAKSALVQDKDGCDGAVGSSSTGACCG